MDVPLKSSRYGSGGKSTTGNRRKQGRTSAPKKKDIPHRKKQKPVKAPAPKRQEKPQEEWSVEISKQKIAEFPVITWDGPVRFLRTFEQMKKAVKEILKSGERHLGFDTETRPNFVKGRPPNKTALIQLGTHNTVYLFHISNLRGHCIDALLPILINANIIKTGVSIHQDVSELQKIQPFRAAGFIDTTSITREKLRIKNGGLQALVAHFMEGRLSKSKKVQMCNWAASYLNPSEIKYAATDAWVSREVHVRAEKALKESRGSAATTAAKAEK